MKKIVSLVGVVAIVMSWPVQILAATNANYIVISEVQTGSSNDASQEFIELYNPTSASLTLDNWIIEYASASGATWTKKATLASAIPAHGFYLVATAGYGVSDATMASGLASTGGHVRLKSTSGEVIDVVGWGTATQPEYAAIGAPVAGGSIERLPGRLSNLAGNGQDTNNNSTDFVVRDVADPQNKLAAVEDPSQLSETDPDPVEVSPPEDAVITPPVYLPITITEAFPDPASPLTDAKDEFIELYNPNSEPVNLKGYVLRAGSGFKSFYTIGDVSIEPGSYMSFFSIDTSLALPNSGSAVQILDPLGNILDVSDPYGPAKTGQAWADVNGVWAWTLEPTAGAANVLSAPSTPTKTTAAKATSTKKATTKKVAAKKTTTKAAKASTKKAKAKTPKTGIAMATTAITEPSPLARWLLIAAGCFTIMYAIYGFRHDLYNYYIKSRRHAAAWLQHRPALSWRRNHRTGQ